MRKLMYVPAAIFLTACQVGEEYHFSPVVSDFNTKQVLNLQQPKADISRQWYTIFKDSDLNTLLNLVICNNLDIQKALERLQQSRYSFAIYSKENFPMLNASGGYDFRKASDHEDLSYDQNSFKQGFDVAWELDIWGKGKYISEQYFQFMQNYRYTLEDVKVSIVAETVDNYINLREAQEKLRIAKYNLRLQRDILQTIKDKYKAGIADDLALSQAEFAVETTKSTIPPLEYQIEAYKNAIAVLAGVLPNQLPISLQKYSKNITAKTFWHPTKSLYELPLNVVRSRPDIVAAESMILAQNAAVGEAITSLYPTVNLGATFGFISTSGHSLFDNDSQVYGYTPGITLPIWQWGRLTNNIELQKHIREEYLLSYNEAMLTAVTEIKNAITSVEQAYKTNTYRKTSFQKMKTIMDLTNEKYKNGLVEFTDVATAEMNLLQAQTALAESNAEILHNWAMFYKAVGGGYNIN